MIALYIIIGIIIGFVITFLMMKQDSIRKLNELRHQLSVEHTQSEKMIAAELNRKIEKLTEEKSESDRMRAVAETKLEEELQHAEKLRNEIEKQTEQKNKLLQEEMKLMAENMMKNTRQELNNADKERLDKIIEPLKEKMDEFSKAVNDSNRDNTANKAEIKTAFEEAMKQLHNVQERTVRELKEQTERIGQGAEHLTQALKGDSKLQGDWGEMILERTLENCGLKKDDQYLIQPTYKDNEGKIMRPDAVVLFPNDESIIIDSKVSLTAYQEALNTSNDDEREKHLKEHITSVKKHIDELTDKNYEKIVPNSIGYVLMFIPYESGYVAAIKTDPGILQYAYKKKIIIISPANLLMTLQLTHTMWQNYRMNKNVEEIMRQSSDLYDKFVSYAETFVKMDKDIENLRTHFEQARNQLSSGKGNVIKRLENMKQLGVNPKKEIPENIKELN